MGTQCRVLYLWSGLQKLTHYLITHKCVDSSTRFVSTDELRQSLRQRAEEEPDEEEEVPAYLLAENYGKQKQ